MIVRRTAIKNDLLAGEVQTRKFEKLGDPLQKIAQIVDFRALAENLDCVTPVPCRRTVVAPSIRRK